MEQDQETPIPRVISVARRPLWPWRRMRRSARKRASLSAVRRDSMRAERRRSRALPASAR